MITAAFVINGVAGLLFIARLLIGPTVIDRIVALDALLVVVMCGVLLDAADNRTTVGIESVLVIALLGFIGTGVLARYVEQRGG